MDTLTITTTPEKSILTLQGDLTIAQAAGLHKDLLQVSADRDVEVVCEGVGDLDLSFLQLLFGLLLDLRDKGRILTLSKPTAQMRDTIKQLGFQALLSLEGDAVV